MKEVAAQWMKIYACHEVDRGSVVGFHFLTVWNPLFTLSKIEETPTFMTSSVAVGGYEFEIGNQLTAPLCAYELEMLHDMVHAAIECRINHFMLIEKGRMADVIGQRLTWSWANSAVTIAVAEKMSLLNEFAGLFDGHSAYQSTIEQITRLQGVDYV